MSTPPVLNRIAVTLNLLFFVGTVVSLFSSGPGACVNGQSCAPGRGIQEMPNGGLVILVWVFADVVLLVVWLVVRRHQNQRTD